MFAAQTFPYFFFLRVRQLESRVFCFVAFIHLGNCFVQEFPFADIALAQSAPPHMAMQVDTFVPRQLVVLLEYLQVRSFLAGDDKRP